MWKVPGRMRDRYPSPLYRPPEKGATGKRGISRRSLKGSTLFPLSLNLNITAKSSANPFLDHSTRHIGRTRGIATSRDTLYIWMMSKVKVSEEQSIDILVLVTLAWHIYGVPKILHLLTGQIFFHDLAIN